MQLLNVLWAYILVFLLADTPFFEALAIVPIAIVGGLNPLLVLIIALVGNLLTVYLVIVFINKIKSWRERKKEKKKKVNVQKGHNLFGKNMDFLILLSLVRFLLEVI
ncbi:small multi-drug export protein [Halalkalibacter alkalisediminis]|uniref:Small multi-drug export protein n=1 Tax=Halalkalibacter alkalisediminis TaxID=935616 RepID=A0ABV6NGZ9_9BACI|nr:small multi-drug export protein [Halalkalibacter alkalisediminis]